MPRADREVTILIDGRKHVLGPEHQRYVRMIELLLKLMPKMVGSRSGQLCLDYNGNSVSPRFSQSWGPNWIDEESE